MNAAHPFSLLGPRLLPWAIRLDRAPAGLWLGLQALALWPAWVWLGARWYGGADGPPLGLLALGALAFMVWRLRGQLRSAPRLPWLIAALAGTLGATLLRMLGAPLPLSGLAAAAASAAGLLAFLPQERLQQARAGCMPRWLPVAALPVLGLAVLALPLLQSSADFALRALADQSNPWLGGNLLAVEASGADAWMLWAGCFTACAAALAAGRGNRAFLRRLPIALALALAGMVLRGSLLAGLQADGHAAAGWQQGVGLPVLALVCLAIADLMVREEKTK